MTHHTAGRESDTSQASWVCLMYHDIAPRAAGRGGGPERFAVSIDAFKSQLNQLVAEGYRVCSLRNALSRQPGRIIAITFDDGTQGQYEHGFKELAARGMSATFFVTTDRIGKPGYVSWTQLREVRAAGMDVQSHGKTHRFLSELDASDLEAELRVSKSVLDEQLQQNTEMLALPGGDWPRRPLRPVIGAVGFSVTATSRWGSNALSHASRGESIVINRCTVAGPLPLQQFRRIAAGDPWLGLRRRARERTLTAVRSALGASRYALWRRRILDGRWDAQGAGSEPSAVGR